MSALPIITEAQNQFFSAIARQRRNTAIHRCPSCGQIISDFMDDCCEPQRAFSDSDRAKELLQREGNHGF